jgi:hypothetical protein
MEARMNRALLRLRLGDAVVLVCIAVTLAGCSGGSHDASGGSPARRLQDVRDVSPVRNRFNADDGHPRLLVLFSPT